MSIIVGIVWVGLLILAGLVVPMPVIKAQPVWVFVVLALITIAVIVSPVAKLSEVLKRR